MGRMDPAYRKTDVIYRNALEAMQKMRMDDGEKIATIMLAKQPKAPHPKSRECSKARSNSGWSRFEQRM